MEQAAVYDIAAFDRSKVDLNRAPRNVDEYLQQVVVSRENCADVAVATNIDTSTLKNAVNVVPEDHSLKAVCDFLPSSSWRQTKVDNFEVIRTEFAQRRELFDNPIQMKFPNQGEQTRWLRFCLQERCPDVVIPESQMARFQHHSGTPPTLNLLLSLPDRLVNYLAMMLMEQFTETGYSLPLAEWIFSLLIALRKPLLRDVCTSLRHFARYCRIERAKLQATDVELIRQYTLFVAITSIYFGQKDLADK